MAPHSSMIWDYAHLRYARLRNADVRSYHFTRQIYDGDIRVRYAFEDPFLGVWVRRRLVG